MTLAKQGILWIAFLGAAMSLSPGCTSRRRGDDIEKKPVSASEARRPFFTEDPAPPSKDLDPLRVRAGDESVSTRGGPLERRRPGGVDENEEIALPGEEPTSEGAAAPVDGSGDARDESPARDETSSASELIPIDIPPNAEAPRKPSPEEEAADATAESGESR